MGARRSADALAIHSAVVEKAAEGVAGDVHRRNWPMDGDIAAVSAFRKRNRETVSLTRAARRIFLN